MAYPNINEDPDSLGIKTKGENLEDLQYKTGNHGYESILKSLKINEENYKKKFKSLRKRKFS